MGKSGESGRSSIKLDASKDKTWTVQRDELNITKVKKWTTRKTESRRSYKLLMDSPKDLKWTVLKSKMNGQKSQNGRFKRLNAK